MDDKRISRIGQQYVMSLYARNNSSPYDPENLPARNGYRTWSVSQRVYKV